MRKSMPLVELLLFASLFWFTWEHIVAFTCNDQQAADHEREWVAFLKAAKILSGYNTFIQAIDAVKNESVVTGLASLT